MIGRFIESFQVEAMIALFLMICCCKEAMSDHNRDQERGVALTHYQTLQTGEAGQSDHLEAIIRKSNSQLNLRS